MTSKKTAAKNHGQRFLDLLCRAIRSMPVELLAQDNNNKVRAGLPSDFESRLAEFLSEKRNLPPGFDDLIVKSRGADFQFKTGETVRATCEFKGAARGKVLKKFDCKFTFAIMIDVLKQLIRWPHSNRPTSQHYVAVLLLGRRNAVTVTFRKTVMDNVQTYLRVTCTGLLAEEIILRKQVYTQLIFRVIAVGPFS